MAKLITTIFASSGDKTYPPLTSTDGSVNLTNGYTDQYEIDLASGDPTAKAVERDIMNGLFSWLFENQSFDQAHGVAPWFSTYTGGYPLNALVADNSTGTWQIYRSLVDANTAITTATASWEVLLTQTEILARIPFALGGASGSANGALTSGTSLNSWAYSQGTWVVPTDAIAASLVNAPSARQGVLIARNTTTQYNPTTTANGGSFFQMYFDANGYSYIRFFGVASGGSTATWSAWRTIAFLDSPAFTGTPTAPTAAAGTNTTQLATTAYAYAAALQWGVGVPGASPPTYVYNPISGSNISASRIINALSTDTQTAVDSPVSGQRFGGWHVGRDIRPAQFGVSSQGSGASFWYRGFSTAAALASDWKQLADIASPTFTGIPAAPTAAAGTNTTQIASTAFVTTAAANAVTAALAAAKGVLLGAPKIFTASGTYTPSSNCDFIIVEMVGGGGASGAVPASSTSANFASGGGGGGAYLKFYLGTLPSSVTVTVGAAGALAGGTGGSGGATSFGSYASVGGGGGSTYNQASNAALLANGGARGGSISSSGVTVITAAFGDAGGTAVMISGGNGALNNGGSSKLGTGGNGSGNGAGVTGSGYGSGGGGSMTVVSSTGTAYTGAVGQPGVIIIYEYGHIVG